MNGRPLVAQPMSSPNYGAAFHLAPEFQDCGVYTLTWKSMLTSAAQTCRLMFESPNGYWMGQFGFQDAGRMVLNRGQTELASTWMPGRPQVFELRLDTVGGTIDVAVDGVADPQGQAQPLWEIPEAGLRRIWLEPAGTGFDAMVLDDVQVTAEGCATVAAEARSWSTVKARY